MSDKTSTEKTGEVELPAAKPIAKPATKPAAETPPAPTAPKPRGRKGLWFTLVLTFGVALAAASAGGLLWWQQSQSEAAMALADSAVALSVDEIRNAVESLEEDVGTLQRSDAAQLEASGRIGANVDDLSIRFGALESRVDDFQGVSGDARRRWLLAEAEHYLNLGNAELSLGGRWETAIVALELADGALRQLADPAFAGVRQQIAADLQTLGSAELADVEGLSYTLSRLAGRVGRIAHGSRDARQPDRRAPGACGCGIGLEQGLAQHQGCPFRHDQRGAQRRGGIPRADRARAGAGYVRQLELELEMARLGLLQNRTGGLPRRSGGGGGPVEPAFRRFRAGGAKRRRAPGGHGANGD